MTKDDRIFELEKSLEVVLDLFDDTPDGKVWIDVEFDAGDGSAQWTGEVDRTSADTVLSAIKTLYSEEEIDE